MPVHSAEATPARPQRERSSGVPEPITIRVDDASRISGLGRSMLYRLMDENRIENVRVDGARLIKLDSLRRLLTEGS